MPMIDRQCNICSEQLLDKFVHTRAERDVPIPCSCGGELVYVVLPGQGATVIGDEIPGGTYMKHGVCHEDGSPKRFDSKSAIRAEARAKGYTWGPDAHHVPKRGSDKHPDTTRWT